MKNTEAAGAGTGTGTKTGTEDVSRPLSPRELGQQRAALTAILEAPSDGAADREYDAATRFENLTKAEKRAMAKRQRPEPEPAPEEDEDDEVVIARAQKDVRAKRAAAEDAAEPEPKPKKKKVGREGNTNARRNPNNPQSGHAGVSWNARTKKWIGSVQNKLEKTASGKKKHETTARFPLDQEEACAQATEALRARLDGEYKAEMERRAAADPLTRDLPRGPEDAADAEERVVYWRPNEQNDHTPYRAVRWRDARMGGGWRWIRACVECASKAVQAKFGCGVSLYCKGHLPSADRCPCGESGSTLRIDCQICRGKDAEAAGKAAGKLANLCARCQDTGLAPKRRVSKGGNGLCAPCEERLNEEAREAGAEGLAPAKGKSWEDLCLDMLVKLVPHGIEMRDSMTQMIGTLLSKKRKVRAGRAGGLGGAADQDCDTTKQRRPDLLYVLRHPETGRIVCCIVVEIDEKSHSHPSYLTSCELGRCDDLVQALSIHAQREGFADDRAGHGRLDAVRPIVYVLKLNPNACNATPKTLRLEDRIQTLADRINAIFDLPRQELVDAIQRNDADTLVPRVELFYYHTKHAARHIQGYEEAHAQGSLLYAGNVVS